MAQTSSQQAGGRGTDNGVAATTGGDGKASEGGATMRADVDDDTGERSGKHRRRQTEAETSEAERKAADARRAQELRRQIEDATAAQT